MFYYDLLAAHRLVYGDTALVTALPERLRDASRIPMHESTRLLFNRWSGLYYSRFMLTEEGQRVDKTFVERNHAKACLAFADSVLTLNGRYHWSCRTRYDRLGEALAHRPANFDQLVAWHESAVEFKLIRVTNRRRWRCCWRGRGRWRGRGASFSSGWNRYGCGRGFGSAEEYASWKGRLLPEFPVWRNLASTCGTGSTWQAAGSGLDYPRGPLQRALALLLREDRDDSKGRKGDMGPEKVRRLLSIPVDATTHEVYDTYRHWWRFYN